MASSVLLVHGWAATPAVWPPQLLPPQAHVHPWTTPDAALLQAQLRELYQRSGSPVHLIGWSTGGMLALEAAASCPEAVARLVLIGSTARFTQAADYDAGLPAAVVRQLSRRLQRDPGEALDSFYRLMFAPAEDRWQEPFLAASAHWASRLAPAQLQAGLAYLAQQDLRPLLPRLTVPALILHGQEDRICPVAAAHHLAQHLPQAKQFTLPAAGHVPFLTQVQTVRSILQQEEIF